MVILEMKKRVVIVGGGFAGLNAARVLGRFFICHNVGNSSRGHAGAGPFEAREQRSSRRLVVVTRILPER